MQKIGAYRRSMISKDASSASIIAIYEWVCFKISERGGQIEALFMHVHVLTDISDKKTGKLHDCELTSAATATS